MKVVFDTNVYISGLIFKGGIPSRLIDLARDGHFELFYSPEILDELNAVLEIKFELTLHERDKVLSWLRACGNVVYPEQRVKIVKADDADNRILECTFTASADYLITGDKKHLLSLKTKLPFAILSPAQFYEKIAGK